MYGNYSGAMDQSMFFNPDAPQEICPSIWLGPYTSLSQNNFLVNKNVKIIINCLTTDKFLQALDEPQVTISSDVIILSLDPSFSADCESKPLVDQFIKQFNRILQNYLQYFYVNNPNSGNLIHQIPNNQLLSSITSPILQGNLKLQFFNLIRLINLFKCINSDMQILVVSETGNANLSTGLIIAYLMDCYNYNLPNSFSLIQSSRPSVSPLNNNYYDDLLIIENLKKFMVENNSLKKKTPGEDEIPMEEDMDYNEICVGGDRKRRFRS
ncbi:uncharacterized protein RJT20DRAFT_90235 [Scheffersomyces xylosifermentans]|uniref:uncharacterized protein n=1 Tax=Scheffersomyces xylosifermentans TaxID=1304137 RepID=UPI00315D01C8